MDIVYHADRYTSISRCMFLCELALPLRGWEMNRVKLSIMTEEYNRRWKTIGNPDLTVD